MLWARALAQGTACRCPWLCEWRMTADRARVVGVKATEFIYMILSLFNDITRSLVSEPLTVQAAGAPPIATGSDNGGGGGGGGGSGGGYGGGGAAAVASVAAAVAVAPP